MSGPPEPEADQKIDPSAWIAPSAQIYGAVTIGPDASVWHNAVLRAECERIEIGQVAMLIFLIAAMIRPRSPAPWQCLET